MKKILFILFLVLCSFLSKGQFAKPTGAVPVPQFSFFRTPLDSGFHVYQFASLYNSFWMKFDTVKVKGLATQFDLLSFLQKKDTTQNQYGYIPFYRYQFLMLKNDSSKYYKFRNDSITNKGFYTNYKASLGAGLYLPNDTWTKVYDYVGNLTNGWKKSKDNIFEFAGILGINKFYHVQNPGINEIVSIPLSTASTTGTEHGIEIAVGGNKIMKVSAKVSATGTADSTRITLSPGTMLGVGKNAKASIDIEAGTAARVPIQMASSDTTGLTRVGAILFNGLTYYGLNATGIKHFAYLQNPHFKDTVTTPTLQVTKDWTLGSLLIGAAPHRYIPSTFGQGVLIASSAGVVSSLGFGAAGTIMTSNGPTAAPSFTVITVSSGDFLDAVIGMQVDATLDPTLTNGYRYIILASGALHANFGTINKNLAGSALTLGDGDIVQYVTGSSEFRITYDASAAAAPATVTVTLDKNGNSIHDWTYSVDADVWVDRGTATLHNSLSDLNTGTGKYYHITQAQDASGVLIKSDTVSLVGTKANLFLKKDKTDSTATDGYTSRARLLQGLFTKVDKVTDYSLVLNSEIAKIHVAGSDNQDLSGLVVKNDSSKLYERIANKVASISGSSTDIQYPTAKLLYDQLALKITKNDSSKLYKLKTDSTAGVGYTSRNRLATELFKKVNKNDSSKLYKLKTDSILNSGFYTNYKASFLQSILLNNTWLTAIDAAGNPVNLLKISKDNLLEFAPKVGINQFYFVQNQGVNSIVDIPVSADSPDNTEHGTKIVIGGQQVMKVSATSDGVGGVDTIRVEVQNIRITEGSGIGKALLRDKSNGQAKWSTLALGTAAYKDNTYFVLPNDSSKLYKLKTDSTATDGYTRRDRLTSSLTTKQPLATVLTHIQDSLNLHEHLANKSTNVYTDADSDVKYPSAKAVYTFGDSKVADVIVDGITSTAPSENAVFDGLALKVALESGKHLPDNNFTDTDSTKVAGLPNYSVQALSGTTPAWNSASGINATLTLSGNTTITLSNLVAGTSGNITLTNPATAYTVTFSGYTNKISPGIYTSANVATASGGSKIDVLSWWYDGTYLHWAGTKDLK